jgi:hypothetical protein
MMENIILIKSNEWADFWRYDVGVNVIPANTAEKTTDILWKEDPRGNWQIEPIPQEIHDGWKSRGMFDNGLAIVCGQVFRGKYKGMWLNAIDCDNKSGTDAMCPTSVEHTAKGTLVEQHANPEKCHIFFYTDNPLKNRLLVDGQEIKIEIKSAGKNILYCAGGHHKDGSLIDIVGTQKIQIANTDELQKQLDDILGVQVTKLQKKDSTVKGINEEAKKYDKEQTDRQGWILSKLGSHFHKIHIDEIDEIDCINKSVALNAKLTLPYDEQRAIEIGTEYYNRYRKNGDDSKINPTQQKKIDENWKIIKDPLSSKTEIKKAKKAINKIEESAEATLTDWSEDDVESIYKQVTSILNKKIKRTIISENNKSQVIVLIEQGNHVEALDLESVRFRQLLQFIVSKELELEPIDKEDYDKIISQLIANAQIGGAKIEKIFNRLQSDEKRIVIDLGNDNFECVEITKEDIEIKPLDEYSPILLRYQTTHAQVKPEYGHANAIKEFAELLNFKDVPLFSVHLVALFLADVTTPIMALTGKAGSQKTTTSAAIKRIIDPAGDSLEANVLSIPTKRDDIIMTLYNRYLTVFENVSKIDTDTSDILCRGVTGSSNTKRAHYKNLEEIIMTFKRKIILNGVTPNFNNGDLQTRIVKYSKKEEITFLTDSEFEEKFVALRPKVLGQIFEVLQKVLGRINDFNVTAKTRMAEFERWGELISQELGYEKNTFGEIYEEKMKVTSIENKDAYPIIGIIENIMVDKREYEDSVSNLFSFIKKIAGSLGIDPKNRFVSFPKASNQLIDKITDVATIFENLGLKITTWNNTDNPKFGKNIKLIKIINFNVEVSITHRYSCNTCNYNSVTATEKESEQVEHRKQSGCETHTLEVL